MTAPTDNAALRAALQTAWDKSQTLPPIEFADHEADEIIAALAVAIPPEQDGYAEGFDWEEWLLTIEQLLTPAGNVWLGDEPECQREAYALVRARLEKLPDTATPTDRHGEGRIAGLEEAAKILRARADDEEDLCGYLALDAAETAIRTLANEGTAV